MASFFGEVVFPTSRAFWDDEEECGPTGQPVYQPEFLVRWLKEKPTRISKLIVIEGSTIIDFSRDCLARNSEEICFVEDEKHEKACTIYQINIEEYLCIVSPNFDVKFSSKLVDKMADILSSAENTICITHRHRNNYFKKKNIPTVTEFLRMLVTKSGNNVCKLKEPFLEQPNIIYGVTAGVLSYKEFMEQPAVLYVLYTDNSALDSIAAEPLVKLFTAMNCTLHDVSLVGKDFFNKGNLYM